MPINHIISILSFLLCSISIVGQGTIDATNVNSYIIGGDQKQASLVYTVPSLSIVDMEPETGNSTVTLSLENLEAGLTAFQNGLNVTRWLNISSNASNLSVYLDLVQAIPEGMTITLYCTKLFIPDELNNNCGVCAFSSIELTANETEIIQDIQTCVTGDGSLAGYELEFTFEGNTVEAANYVLDLNLEIK